MRVTSFLLILFCLYRDAICTEPLQIPKPDSQTQLPPACFLITMLIEVKSGSQSLLFATNDTTLSAEAACSATDVVKLDNTTYPGPALKFVVNKTNAVVMLFTAGEVTSLSKILTKLSDTASGMMSRSAFSFESDEIYAQHNKSSFCNSSITKINGPDSIVLSYLQYETSAQKDFSGDTNVCSASGGAATVITSDNEPCLLATMDIFVSVVYTNKNEKLTLKRILVDKFGQGACLNKNHTDDDGEVHEGPVIVYSWSTSASTRSASKNKVVVKFDGGVESIRLSNINATISLDFDDALNPDEVTNIDLDFFSQKLEFERGEAKTCSKRFALEDSKNQIIEIADYKIQYVNGTGELFGKVTTCSAPSTASSILTILIISIFSSFILSK